MAQFFFNTNITNAGGVKLAPDSTFDTRSRFGTQTVTVDPSAGLTTVLNVSGKWLWSTGVFKNLISEDYTIELTIDGEEVWNGTITATDDSLMVLASYVYGGGSSFESATGSDASVIINSSMLLRMQSTTDTSIDFEYKMRPIL